MCRVLTAVPGRGPGRRAEQYSIDDMTAMAAQPNGRRLQAEESDLHVSPLPSRRPRSTIRNAISFNSRESETEGTESRAPPLTGGNLHCLITSNSSIARLCLCVRLSTPSPLFPGKDRQRRPCPSLMARRQRRGRSSRLPRPACC